MPTLVTDPRSGGTAKSSGVNVLPIIAETWANVRNNSNPTNWLTACVSPDSKTDVTLADSGSGGLEECSSKLLDVACYGGVRLSSGRFVSFFFVPEGCSPLKAGRASLYKNGVLNVLAGCDREIEMKPGLTEADL